MPVPPTFSHASPRKCGSYQLKSRRNETSKSPFPAVCQWITQSLAFSRRPTSRRAVRLSEFRERRTISSAAMIWHCSPSHRRQKSRQLPGTTCFESEERRGRRTGDLLDAAQDLSTPSTDPLTCTEWRRTQDVFIAFGSGARPLHDVPRGHFGS